MPANGRGSVVVAVVLGMAAATAGASEPPRSGMPAAVVPAPPDGAVLPAAPVRDLTPPDWPPAAEPPAAPEHAPGHLRPAAPEPDGGLFVTAEYLLLRPRRGAFDYAVTDPNRDLVTEGKLQSLNYELRSGVRAALGYRLPGAGWEVLAGYTYFRSAANEVITAGPGGVLYPTLTRPGLADEALRARGRASFEYNVFDAEIGRRFVLDEHVALRMSGGLRFASIRQDIQAQYDGLDARVDAVTSKSDFDGFGPVVGGEAVWAGGRGFHLYAKANGGMLTGTTRNPLTEVNNAGLTRYVNLTADTRKVVPMAGVGIGGGWEYRQFSFRVGYEITNYFGLIDQPRLADDVSRGKVITRPADLSLEGLFAQAGFSF